MKRSNNDLSSSLFDFSLSPSATPEMTLGSYPALGDPKLSSTNLIVNKTFILNIHNIIQKSLNETVYNPETIDQLKTLRRDSFEMIKSFSSIKRTNFSNDEFLSNSPNETAIVTVWHLKLIETRLNLEIQKREAVSSLQSIENLDRQSRLREYEHKIVSITPKFQELLTNFNLELVYSDIRAESQQVIWTLKLDKDFKSLHQGFNWEIPSFGVITGKNGVGKTQLLDCIQEQFPGMSYRINPTFLANIARIYSERHGDNLQLSQTIETTELSKVTSYARGEIYDTFLPVGEEGFKAMLSYYWHDKNSLSDITAPPPEQGYMWDIVNKLLARYHIGFTLAPPESSNNEFKIFFRKANNDIELSSLSSGELAIFSIISWLGVLQRDESRLKKACFLFDEADIHFHPSYSQKFFAFIDELTSDKNADIRVVITTHNPATLSLLNDSVPIFILERGVNNRTSISQATNKRQAISNLSDGLLTVVDDINYVLVENEDDAKFYTMVYQKFLSSSFLKSHVSKLIFTPVGVKIFKTETLDDLGTLVSSLKSEKEETQDTAHKIATLVNILKEGNDIGGGCSQVMQRVTMTEYQLQANSLGVIENTPVKIDGAHQPQMIWGLLDGDKTRHSENNIYALDVYSFENHICMPINLYYLLKKDFSFNNKKLFDEISPKIEKMESAIIDPSDESKIELNRLLNEATSYVVEYLKHKIEVIQSNMRGETSTAIPKTIDSLHKGLNGKIKPLNLANGMFINCPVVFFDGLPGGGNGHKLFDCIGYLIYGSTRNYNMKKHIFGALEKVPAAFLPNNLLDIMNDLSSSKVAVPGIKKRGKPDDTRSASVADSSPLKRSMIEYTGIS